MLFLKNFRNSFREYNLLTIALFVRFLRYFLMRTYESWKEMSVFPPVNSARVCADVYMVVQVSERIIYSKKKKSQKRKML